MQQKSAGFTKEERRDFGQLLESGFVDTVRRSPLLRRSLPPQSSRNAGQLSDVCGGHSPSCVFCFFFGSSSGTRTRTCSSSPTGPIASTAAPRTSVRISYFLFLISYLIMISNNHRSTL